MEDVYWECFFNNAGISGPSSKDYASIFVKNKISQPILIHLNDSHLKAMGIEAVGDIIRILKYIKDFPQIEKSSKIIKETAERFIEILPVSESPKPNTDKLKVCSSYEKIPGFEVPVPIRRVVTPEIEGRYKIKQPSKALPLKNTQQTIVVKPTITSNRIVILSDNSKSEEKQNTSVLKRLGKSLEKCDKMSCSNNVCQDLETKPDVLAKKQKLQVVDNKTILKRFFNASLSRDSQTKLSLSTKLPAKNIIETPKGNVFLRLGTQESDNVDNPDSECSESPNGLPYMGVFKLPFESNTKRSKIEVRIGHTTDNIRKVEATSTTSSFQHNLSRHQSIKDRLGHR